MLLYYITDRTQFAGTEAERRDALLKRIAEATRWQIDFVQLREKDLCARDLEWLARKALERIREAESRTRLLINSRTDIALAVGAEGVHLRSDDISPQDVLKIWHESKNKSEPVISVSCHTEQEVIAAKSSGANFVVFGPVFEKRGAPRPESDALESLRSAARHGIPVLALGGVTAENAGSCIEAGAAGIAGIRLFQEGDLRLTVENLRTWE